MKKAILGFTYIVMSLMAIDAAAQTSPAKSPAYLEAEANKVRMKTPPKWLSGPEPDIPDSEKALGHHGKVFVSGILGTDGKMRETYISDSSEAPALDAKAREAAQATLFEPARDANGAPMSTVIKTSFEFAAYKSAEPGGGLWRYSCEQFVRDMDWHRSKTSHSAWADHEMYLLIRGLGTAARLRGPGRLEAMLESNESFDRRWQAAIDKCRTRPDLRFNDVMLPEGDFGDAYAKGLGAPVPKRRR